MPQNTHSTDTPALLISLFPYLLKPGTSQNDPKSAKTTRNDPKRPETTQNQPIDPQKIAKRLQTTHNFEIGEIWNFPPVFFFKFLAQMPKFRPFGPKSINFPIF